MKQHILLVCAATILTTAANAQLVHDTVTTNPGYTHNVWYSLANDDQATDPATSWDIALSTSMGAMDELTTSVLFNHKIGSVYEIPGSDPSDFANADTAGLSTWTPLYNSEESWAAGAFNNTQNLGSFDYGWGNYNMSTHGIDANRIFVIKYTNGTYRKLAINSANTANTYTLVFDALDNSDLTTETIDITTYTSKNFVGYNLIAKVVVDREPASASWDLYFHQYPSFDYNPPYTVTGVFHNVGVQVAQVYPVNDPESYEDFSGAVFEDAINTIGYDWKAFNGMGFAVADSTVYVVKDKTGDVWKVIFTGFGGSASGKYMFAKEKLSSASIDEHTAIIASLYPNPSADEATLILSNAPDATVEVYSLSGTRMYAAHVDAAELTAVPLPVREFAEGMYQVVITTSATVTAQKLMVRR